jgi:SAM-dependent methyltransferase
MTTDHSPQDRVRDYYAQFGEREWLRLANAEDGAIEFALTCHALSTCLPKQGRILDIGGGPGRYTIWLAERGYRVVLADLSPDLLDIAKVKIDEAGVGSNVESIGVADARDLKAWRMRRSMLSCRSVPSTTSPSYKIEQRLLPRWRASCALREWRSLR